MDLSPRSTFAWKLRRTTLALGVRTLVMGILNATPDSFSDGGRDASREEAVARGLRLLDEGANLVDLGGESTRPGAEPLSAGEEQDRVLPVLGGILQARPGAVVSIDTYHAGTARLAVEAGAEIVNDVSGHLWDGAMGATCAELRCGNVLVHTRGRPPEWKLLPVLGPEEVLPLVLKGLRARADAAVREGSAAASILLDPGFGFGKIGGANYTLLAKFGKLRELGYPLLAGVSRKGFLAGAGGASGGGTGPATRLYATIAANTAAILAGAHVIRVHDVMAAREAAAVADAILGAI